MDLSAFRDPDIARRLISAIGSIDVDPVSLMEVCGTHTVAIAKNGLRDVLPDHVRLISGPGCPVCVTANRDIDTAIEFCRQPGVAVATFGDMMKVPGSYSSLAEEKAKGADVRIIYSPLDALEMARKDPGTHVVFVGVGFETTAPIIAAAIKRAMASDVDGFSVFSAHKTVPPALEALVNDPQVQIDGLILPGHVSTIIGVEPYRYLAKDFGVPGVITGFEPVDVLQGIWMLLKQHAESNPRIEIAYDRGVMEAGNPTARALITEVFEPVDTEWRGLGVIPGSGLAIRDTYARFDATKRVPVNPAEPRNIAGCQCGDVLRGAVLPYECRLFARGCTPEHPVGPCMVSSEGSCAAYYRYTDYGKDSV